MEKTWVASLTLFYFQSTANFVQFSLPGVRSVHFLSIVIVTTVAQALQSIFHIAVRVVFLMCQADNDTLLNKTLSNCSQDKEQALESGLHNAIWSLSLSCPLSLSLSCHSFLAFYSLITLKFFRSLKILSPVCAHAISSACHTQLPHSSSLGKLLLIFQALSLILPSLGTLPSPLSILRMG